MSGRWLPSPATMIAVVALVAALAGTAVALPGKKSVKANDLAKDAVTSRAIKNDAVRPDDLAPRAHLWAEVGAEAVLRSGSEPNIVVSRVGPAQGSYLVDFNRGEIGTCSAVAQISGFTPGGNIPAGFVATELDPAGDAVRVETANVNNNREDRSFTVAVHC